MSARPVSPRSVSSPRPPSAPPTSLFCSFPSRKKPRALPSALVSTGLVQEVWISGQRAVSSPPSDTEKGHRPPPGSPNRPPEKVLEEVTRQGGSWEGPGERGTEEFPKANKKQSSSVWTGDPIQETRELAPPPTARPPSSKTAQGDPGPVSKTAKAPSMALLTQDQERGLSEMENYGVGAHASKAICCLDRTRDKTEGTTS